MIPLRFGNGQLQTDRKDPPGFDGGFDPDPQGVGDFPYDGQSNPAVVSGTGPRGILPPEGIKDAIGRLRGQGAAGVGNRQDRRIIGGLGLDPDAPPIVGVVHRIIQDIGQNHRQMIGVGDTSDTLRNTILEVQAAVKGLVNKDTPAAFDKGSQRNRLAADRQLLSVEPGQRQQRIDHLLHGPRDCQTIAEGLLVFVRDLCGGSD